MTFKLITKLTTKPISVGAGAVYPYLPSLLDLCERSSRFDSKEKFNLARVIGSEFQKRILVPRNLVDITPGVSDIRSKGKDVVLKSSFVPRDNEQSRCIEECVSRLSKGENFVFEAPTGFGKCHGIDTPVIMFNGSVKMVQDIVVGDLLMGPDSKPRKVLATTKGAGPLFKVTPHNGDSFVCNDVHVLSLKSTSTMGGGSTYSKGAITNIPLNEYLGKSKTFKHMMKLWKTGVEWGTKELHPIDPYFLGALLGDGSFIDGVNLTTADQELIDEVYTQAALHGLEVRVYSQVGNKSSSYAFSQRGPKVVGGNLLKEKVSDLGLFNTDSASKFIPKRYLVASHQARLELLAGLIDTDGHHIKNCYELTFKSKALHDDSVFLARSVGLAVSRSIKVVDGVSYYRAFISGDTSVIPVRIPRKKAAIRQQVKDPLLSGFSVDSLGVGDYFGFTLDGDHLYLLGDFTVTHNTWVSSEIVARIGKKTIIVVTKDDIIDQWDEAFKATSGISIGKGIGLIRGDVCNVGDNPVVIAMVQSLAKEGRYAEHIFHDFGFMVVDECFPRGTLVDGKPIENYAKGDVVSSVQPDGSVGLSTVLSVSAKQGSWFTRASHRGYNLVSTSTQPVFVSGVGFIPAGLLQENDYVVRQMQIPSVDPHQENKGEIQQESSGLLLQGARGVISERERGCEIWSGPSGMEQEALFSTDEGYKPYATTGDSGEGVQSLNGEAFTTPTWGKRGRLDHTSKNLIQRFEAFISSSGVPDWSATKLRDWYAQEVHDGHCNSESEAVHRSRWAFAQYFEAQGLRLSSGCVLEESRVDSVESEERGSAIQSGWGIGSGEVFNLEVEGTHNYFAEGVLVHNCHRIGADFFSQACFRVPALLRMGVSATPDRKDGREEVIEAHIGPVRVRSEAMPMTPRIITQKSPWECPLQRKTDKEGRIIVGPDGKIEMTPIPHTPKNCSHVLKMLSKHHLRNRLLAVFIAQCYKAGRKILVQSDFKEHLEALEPLISTFGVPPKEITYYVGGLSKHQRNDAKKGSVVLATYKMTSEATDIPELDALVMCTPKADVAQIVGRVIRHLPDKKQPVVFDVQDDSSPLFKNYGISRLKWYQSKNAPVTPHIDKR